MGSQVCRQGAIDRGIIGVQFIIIRSGYACQNASLCKVVTYPLCSGFAISAAAFRG